MKECAKKRWRNGWTVRVMDGGMDIGIGGRLDEGIDGEMEG